MQQLWGWKYINRVAVIAEDWEEEEEEEESTERNFMVEAYFHNKTLRRPKLVIWSV